MRAWLVPHTHWDREWYATADDLRVRLARMLDDALDALERDPRLRFSLDGQSVVVEDYLTLRPEQRGRLQALLASRRVVMGPMYAITDEHLVSGESLTRNFALGCADARALDVEPMRLCYAPDTFAHVAQLPQIMRGFGLGAIVFTRGLGDASAGDAGVFTWLGDDGTSVLAIQQPGSYAAAHRIGYELDGQAVPAATREEVVANAVEQVSRLVGRHRPILERSGVHDLLMSSGVDHGPLQHDVGAIVEEATALVDGVDVRVGTYEDYLAAVEAGLDASAGAALPTVHGELPGGFDSHQLRGVASARIPLKQANERTERELQVAEALAALAVLAGDRIPQRAAGPFANHVHPATGLRRELDWAWRELLKNHAHDSIWGSSTDEVHADMEQRFRTARHVARRVVRIAVALLSGEPERYDYQPLSATFPRTPTAQRAVTWINPVGFARDDVVGMRIPADLRDVAELHAVVDGRARPVQVVRRPRTALAPFAADSADPAYMVHVDLAQTPEDVEALVPISCAAFGTCHVELQTGPARASGDVDASPLVTTHDGSDGAVSIENEHVRLTCRRDGSVTLTDVATGRSISNAFHLLDVADRGDEYSFDPVPDDHPWSSLGSTMSVAVVETGPLRATVELQVTATVPCQLESDRRTRSSDLVEMPIVATLSLDAGSRRVQCSIRIRNTAMDHRLQLLLPLGESITDVRAEAPYAIERRRLDADGADGIEGRWLPRLTQGVVAAGPLVAAGRGINEYDVIRDADGNSVLCLTLLRSVGWLSRSDLVSRPWGAGPTYPTPGAQCLGEHHVELTLQLAPARHLSDADLLRFSQAEAIGFIESTSVVDTGSLISVDTPTDDAVVTMLKQADDGKGAVLRGVWLGDDHGSLDVVAAGRRAQRCSMDERRVVDDATVHPGEIFTVALR